MARAVIITSYLEHPVDIPALLQPDDYIVCLDGGYDIALAQGIRPDLLLGDFDSMQTPLPEDPAITIRRYPPEKDYTDLELAFRVLDPEKTPELLVIGGLGGRLDQTLTNVQMLTTYTASAASVAGERANGEVTPRYRKICIMDGRNLCFAICGDDTVSGRSGRSLEGSAVCRIPRQENCYLSLLPLTDRCCSVTLRGTKYTLEDADILRGASHCVSNEFDGPEAELTIGSGALLVIIAQGNSSDVLTGR